MIEGRTTTPFTPFANAFGLHVNLCVTLNRCAVVLLVMQYKLHPRVNIIYCAIRIFTLP